MFSKGHEVTSYSKVHRVCLHYGETIIRTNTYKVKKTGTLTAHIIQDTDRGGHQKFPATLHPFHFFQESVSFYKIFYRLVTYSFDINIKCVSILVCQFTSPTF